METTVAKTSSNKRPAKPAAPQRKPSTLSIDVPIDEEAKPEFRLHIDVALTGPHAATIKRIAAALDREQARLDNGRRVVNCNDAFRWLIEQIAEEAPPAAD